MMSVKHFQENNMFHRNLGRGGLGYHKHYITGGSVVGTQGALTRAMNAQLGIDDEPYVEDVDDDDSDYGDLFIGNPLPYVHNETLDAGDSAFMEFMESKPHTTNEHQIEIYFEDWYLNHNGGLFYDAPNYPEGQWAYEGQYEPSDAEWKRMQEEFNKKYKSAKPSSKHNVKNTYGQLEESINNVLDNESDEEEIHHIKHPHNMFANDIHMKQIFKSKIKKFKKLLSKKHKIRGGTIHGRGGEGELVLKKAGGPQTIAEITSMIEEIENSLKEKESESNEYRDIIKSEETEYDEYVIAKPKMRKTASDMKKAIDERKKEQLKIIEEMENLKNKKIQLAMMKTQIDKQKMQKSREASTKVELENASRKSGKKLSIREEPTLKAEPVVKREPKTLEEHLERANEELEEIQQATNFYNNTSFISSFKSTNTKYKNNTPIKTISDFVDIEPYQSAKESNAISYLNFNDELNKTDISTNFGKQYKIIKLKGGVIDLLFWAYIMLIAIRIIDPDFTAGSITAIKNKYESILTLEKKLKDKVEVANDAIETRNAEKRREEGKAATKAKNEADYIVTRSEAIEKKEAKRATSTGYAVPGHQELTDRVTLYWHKAGGDRADISSLKELKNKEVDKVVKSLGDAYDRLLDEPLPEMDKSYEKFALKCFDKSVGDAYLSTVIINDKHIPLSDYDDEYQKSKSGEPNKGIVFEKCLSGKNNPQMKIIFDEPTVDFKVSDHIIKDIFYKYAIPRMEAENKIRSKTGKALIDIPTTCRANNFCMDLFDITKGVGAELKAFEGIGYIGAYNININLKEMYIDKQIKAMKDYLVIYDTKNGSRAQDDADEALLKAKEIKDLLADKNKFNKNFYATQDYLGFHMTIQKFMDLDIPTGYDFTDSPNSEANLEHARESQNSRQYAPIIEDGLITELKVVMSNWDEDAKRIMEEEMSKHIFNKRKFPYYFVVRFTGGVGLWNYSTDPLIENDFIGGTYKIVNHNKDILKFVLIPIENFILKK